MPSGTLQSWFLGQERQLTGLLAKQEGCADFPISAGQFDLPFVAMTLRTHVFPGLRRAADIWSAADAVQQRLSILQ
jgi:hypothetical protein